MPGEDRVRAQQILDKMKEVLKAIEEMSAVKAEIDARLGDQSQTPDEYRALAERRMKTLEDIVEATKKHSVLTTQMLEALGIRGEVD